MKTGSEKGAVKRRKEARSRILISVGLDKIVHREAS